MVLAAPACDARGRLLLRQGETLTERAIAKLPALGVSWLEVEAAGGRVAAPSTGPDAEALARIERGIAARFAGLPDGPWKAALQAAVRRARVESFDRLRDLVVDEGEAARG